MFHLLVFVVFIWPILFLPLIFICGKASTTKTEKKEQKSDGGVKSQVKSIEKQEKTDEAQKIDEEPKEKRDSKKEKEDFETEENLKKLDDPEENQRIYEFLDNKEKLEKELRENGYFPFRLTAENRERYMNSCMYWEHFKKCDIDILMKERYYDMRRLAQNWTIVSDNVLEIGRWLHSEIKLAEIFHPFFAKIVQEDYDKYHKQHSTPETLDRLKKVYDAILQHHKTIVEAYENYKKKGTKVYMSVRRSFEFPETWMKREIFTEEEKARYEDDKCSLTKTEERDLLENCKKDFDSECDYMERTNFYMYKKRIRLMIGFFYTIPVSRVTGFVPGGVVREWLENDIEECEKCLSLVKENLEKHKKHHKEPEKLDECYGEHMKMVERMKEYLKEVEKRDRKKWVDSELERKKFPYIGGEWKYNGKYEDYEPVD